ncbi:MAG: hypothetical protein EOP88_17105 [Verrucomicrobiaceae bacterium]|nr:MAG: hypothetical protein EOP88_17105 [Verrucomicrobiaceae bacterium]
MKFPVGRIRQKVREVINMRAGFGKTEAQVLEFVNDLLGGGVNLQDVRDAIEWNHTEGYLRRHEDKELEVVQWFITTEGQAKENIK